MRESIRARGELHGVVKKTQVMVTMLKRMDRTSNVLAWLPYLRFLTTFRGPTRAKTLLD